VTVCFVGSMRIKSTFSVTGPTKAQHLPGQSGVMQLERFVVIFLGFYTFM